MGLVRDPAFWKRFSTAVHRSGEYDKEAGLDSAASSVDVKLGYVFYLCFICYFEIYIRSIGGVGVGMWICANSRYIGMSG